MAFLFPIEPLLHRPTPEGGLCLDLTTDTERLRRAHDSGARGLRALIASPYTPESAVQGLAQGVWAPVGEPAVFIHREEFVLDGGAVKSRWSIVAGLDLAASPLRPVAVSPRETVEVMVGHLRAAGVDPGGITVLYRDGLQVIEKLIETREGMPPYLTLEGRAGERHQVWKLETDEGEKLLRLVEGCRSTLVGDLVLYRAFQKLMDLPGFPRRVRPLVNLYNQRDFGVTLASTALIYARPDDFELNRFIAALHSLYEVAEYRARETKPEDRWREFLEAVRTEGITQRVAGLLVAGIDTAFLVKVPDGTPPPGIDTEVPEPALEYDVEWVARGLVQRLLPSAAAPRVVLTEPRDAAGALSQHEGGIAIILNPPPKRHIPDLADAGWRLPFGSLQLKPPAARGLFLVPLVPMGASQRRASRTDHL